MIEQGLYYATTEFKAMIQSVGGQWNDTKHRPIVCLIKSTEHDHLYWAIPMGKLNHRDSVQKKRLEFYLNLPERDIRSCYYHIGRTTAQSIFFISDAIPITDKYIADIHVGANNKHYIIKNPKLISELSPAYYRRERVSYQRTGRNRLTAPRISRIFKQPDVSVRLFVIHNSLQGSYSKILVSTGKDAMRITVTMIAKM